MSRGYAIYCKDCATTASKTSRNKHWRKYFLRYVYNLTEEEYSKLLEEHGGLCAICSRPDKLQIDHCHKTNKIRGLLCGPCNRALGYFENWAFKQQAVEYLNKHSTTDEALGFMVDKSFIKLPNPRPLGTEHG